MTSLWRSSPRVLINLSLRINSVFIPVKLDFINNDLYYGIKMHDVIRAFGLEAAVPGKPFYVSDESEEKTYSVTIGEDGSISSPKLFAEQGGEGL
jgi:hypothetical protein